MWSCTEESSPSQSSPLASASPQSITIRTQWEEDDYPLATWDPRDLHRPSAPKAEVDAVPFVILVDDVRAFRDHRPCRVAGTADRAVALVTAAMIAGRTIDELWLDYDLRDGTTSQVLVDHLVALAESGVTLPIGRIHVHSSRVPEGQRITNELQAAGYNAVRNYASGIWTRQTVEPTRQTSGTS
jgi:hypothetical protein